MLEEGGKEEKKEREKTGRSPPLEKKNLWCRRADARKILREGGKTQEQCGKGKREEKGRWSYAGKGKGKSVVAGR